MLLDHGPAAERWTLYLVPTTPSYSGDLAWTLPGHCLVKLTSFLDDGDDGVIGQVRLLMLVLLNKLSVRNLSEQTTLPPINKLSVRRLISRLLMFV